ncbi:energy transducer TonB [Ferruginibacter sp. SUN002]|uniref:energy transducer TonB n=1 Tax=Ferruginibacter sp. SUN002 TaxID=2937789 RepID=UPI003D36F5F3
MKSELILKSDVLDILFEDRNKTYGAYILRKFYPNRIKYSLLIMFSTAIALSLFGFISNERAAKATYADKITTKLGSIAADAEPLHKEPPKKEKKASVVVKQEKFTDKFEIVKDNKKTDKLPEDLANSNIGNKNIDDKSNKGGLVGQNIDSVENSSSNKKIEEKIDVNIPTENPDNPAIFPGGMSALREFLRKNLVNPSEMESGEEVPVKVRFVVGFDGKLKELSIIESGGNSFDDEVLRVVKKMPQWTPGNLRGTNVSTYVTIPVKFVGPE